MVEFLENIFNMKSILMLFIYGVACCLAMPKCTEDEPVKCVSLFPFKFEENNTFPIVDINEEFMDKYCDFLQCLNDVFDRCGYPEPEMLMRTVAVLDKFPKPPYDVKKLNKETYNKFCPKTSPLRKKFIANGNCIFKASMEAAVSDCMRISPILENKAEFCRTFSEFRECAQDFIGRRCGQEAKDVAGEMTPSLEHYGCSE